MRRNSLAPRLGHELGRQSTLGGARFVSQNWFGGQALQVYRRAQEFGEQLRDTEAAVPVLSGLFHYDIGQCQCSDAREIAAKLLQIAEQGYTPSVQLMRPSIGNSLRLAAGIPVPVAAVHSSCGATGPLAPSMESAAVRWNKIRDDFDW